MNCLKRIAILTFLLHSPLVATTQAQSTVLWIAPAGGSFTAGSNWNTGSSPSNIDTARFGLDATYSVGFIGSPTNSTLLLEDGEVTFEPLGLFGTQRNYFINQAATINGDLSTHLTLAGVGDDTISLSVGGLGGLAVGSELNGALTLRDGATLSTVFSEIARDNGSSGNVTVSGTNSLWSDGSALRVGSSGNGMVSILQGARLESVGATLGIAPTGTGNVTVDGSDSTWVSTGRVNVGSNGDGSFTVSDGGTVSSTSGIIGVNVNGTGRGLVTGIGSSWTTNGALLVGEEGEASLMIEHGGHVTNNFGRIAELAGSVGQATIAGAGSVWTNNGSLLVGNNGDGTLRINNGGEVLNSLGVLGDKTRSKGHAIVDGTGTQWNNTAELIVGNGGEGLLSITGGAKVSNISSRIGDNAGSQGTVTVDGADTTLSNTSSLSVGNEGAASLHVSNGGVVSSTTAQIGEQTGSVGLVTINDTDSVWTNSSSLSIGSSGNGTLTIEAGGRVENTTGTVASSAQSVGAVTVRGTGSLWSNSSALNVGNSGNGSLIIEDGGRVTSRLISSIAVNQGSIGDVTVRGPGSEWIGATSLMVGNQGRGSLTVEDGGFVASTFASIDGAESEVIIRGAESKWTTSESLFVGDVGRGVLTIEAGGSVMSGSGTIANSLGSTGIVSVQGAGSSWTIANRLTVRDQGLLTIQDGGHVVVDSFTQIVAGGELALRGGSLTTLNLSDAGGRFDWEEGTLTLTGGGLTLGSGSFLFANNTITLGPNQSLNVEGALFVPDDTELFLTGGDLNTGFTIVQPDGQINISGGKHDFGNGLINRGTAIYSDTTINGPVTNPAGSVVNVINDVTFNDLVSGAGGFFGSGTATFNGGHSPGDSPSVVPVEGNLVYGATNDLLIELDGVLDGEFDRLVIQGDAALGGDLVVDLLGSFTPTFGDTFEILDVGGTLTGQFAGLSEGALFGADGHQFTISYFGGDGNNVVLTAVPEPSTLTLIIAISSMLALSRKA